MNRKPFKVAVIGAGISGLSFAHRLLRQANTRSLPLSVNIFEARARAGGAISTCREQSCLIEEGPDSFITDKPWARELCMELGLGDELIGTSEKHRQSYLLLRDVLVPVPEGFYMLGPTRFGPILRSPLFSLPGKLRMMMEPLVPVRGADADESVESFVCRRFGREVFERAAEPMVAGIYAADASHLSARATLPRFVEMETQFGSVTRGLLRSRASAARTLDEGVSGPRYALFMTLRGGLNRLVGSLVDRLPEGSLRLSTPVEGILVDGVGGEWTIAGATDGAFDAACVALPAPQASRLLRKPAPELSRAIGEIPYGESMTMTLAYQRDQFHSPPSGAGFVIPSLENYPIVGCSFSSLKFAARAPEDVILIRVFLGGSRLAARAAASDEELQRLVEDSLARWLHIRGEPRLRHLARHVPGMPHYTVGHLDRVSMIESQSAKFRGLFLVGNAYRGIGLPDCIHSGQRAADSCIEYLTHIHAGR